MQINRIVRNIYIYIYISPLSIHTFDGSDSPYHPSVLYFDDGWNGKRYWMAQTPFSQSAKPYRDRFECPQLHTSNDGIHWQSITDKPIDDLNEQEIADLDYFSDCQLVMADDVLECWYRITRRHGVVNDFSNLYIVRRKSKDGVNWGAREVLFHSKENGADRFGNAIVSPGVIYERGVYKMWYVDNEGSNIQRHVRLNTTSDGRQWNDSVVCNLNGHQCNPWHIDVYRDGATYYLTVYELAGNITLWKSGDGLNFDFVKTLLSARIHKGSFFYDLYRSCLLRVGDKYRLYFSASDLKKTYIGLMEGSSPETMTIVDANPAVPFRTVCQALVEEYIPRAILSFKFRVKSLRQKLHV